MKNFWLNLWNFLKDSFYIILGSAITAFALVVVIIPLDMAPGGVSGLAALFNYLFNIPVALSVIALNIPLFIAGLVKLGRKFIVGSIVGTAVYSVAIEFFEIFMPQIQKYYDVHQLIESGECEKIVFAIVGGALMGLGYGMIFRGNATTGGTDILAKLFQNKMKWLSLGNLVLLVDSTILLIVTICYHSINTGLYSVILAFVSSKVIDIVEAGVNYAKQVYIVTSKPDEISKDIMEKLGRGVTKLDGTGMYSGSDVSVLISVVYNKQLGMIKHIIDDHDRTAFVSITDAREATLYSIRHLEETTVDDKPLFGKKKKMERIAKKEKPVKKSKTAISKK
jgi:uncharacterized membrane-anchored protein YitT (DUF2179 family)